MLEWEFKDLKNKEKHFKFYFIVFFSSSLLAFSISFKLSSIGLVRLEFLKIQNLKVAIDDLLQLHKSKTKFILVSLYKLYVKTEF